MNIADLMTYILESGGAGTLAYLIINQLDGHVAWLQQQSKKTRRLVALVLATLIGVLTVWASSALGFSDPPATAAAWLSAGFSAALASQLFHGVFGFDNEEAAPAPAAATD